MNGFVTVCPDPSFHLPLRKLEFSEGDIGIAGGLQVLEPASANPVTTDSIKRRPA